MFKANSKDYMFLSCHILHSVSPLPLIYRGMRCLTNHRRENQDFRKNEGAAHIGAVSIEWGKQRFSLMMYRFCSSDALYSPSPIFRIFTFLGSF